MNERDIFQRALELTDVGARHEFLNHACGKNAELRQHVEGLLQEYDQLDGFLVNPPIVEFPPEIQPGEMIGPYRVGELLGEGGMGVVYAADQLEPVRREVALKIVKLGMATKDILSRFATERQTLAMMNHPHIASVYDGGATLTGQPYFVMELVRGATLVEDCDQRMLSTRERLALFVKVCHAVQHAHQKGIIHRDLKPSNVLVSNQDGQSVPKVIDFGIAKVIDQPLADRSATTGIVRMIGTPLYMSPEQTDPNDHGVDIRSDIYSLGVLLYELLTGTTPFEKDRLNAKANEEVCRIIREEEPPRPSARVSTIAGELASTVAERRRTDTRRLRTTLRGDLDWIVMRCLEKDRDRRYQTVSDLERDIGRYLVGEPVEACPPSVFYRFRKFASRNAGALVAATLILVCLCGGIVGTTRGMVAARRERDVARVAQENERAQRQIAEANVRRAKEAAAAETAAKEAALASERETQSLLDFFENHVIAAARPFGHDGGLGHDATIRLTIETALPFVETSFEDQPLVKSRLQETIGFSLYSLSEYELALKQLQSAYSIRLAHKGADDPESLKLLRRLAACLNQLDRYDEALNLREELVSRCVAVLGSDHPDTALAMVGLAITRTDLGQYDQAVELLTTALAKLQSSDATDDRTVIGCMQSLANCYRAQGRFHESVELHEQALQRWKQKYDFNHADVLRTMHELAHSYQSVGRLADAEQLLQETVDGCVKELGPQHMDTLKSMRCLALSLQQRRQYVAAMEWLQKVLPPMDVRLGSTHPETVATAYHLAVCQFDLGHYEESLRIHQRILDQSRVTKGSDHFDTLASMSEVAICHGALGQYNEAIELLEAARAACLRTLGADHANTRRVTANLVRAYREADRVDEAMALVDEVIAWIRGTEGTKSPEMLHWMNNTALWLATLPNEEYRLRAVQIAVDLVVAAPDDSYSHRTAGVAHLRVGQYDEAVQALEHGIDLDSSGTGWDWFLLAIAEARRGNREAAVQWNDKAVQWMDSQQPNNQELSSLRAEAGEVLGLIESSKGQEDHGT